MVSTIRKRRVPEDAGTGWSRRASGRRLTGTALVVSSLWLWPGSGWAVAFEGLPRSLASSEGSRRPGPGPVTPFREVSPSVLGKGFELWNDRPGVVIFDYDRDGDADFYLTADGGYPNPLYRNEGNGSFSEVGREAGVAATESFSSGAVACDLNNDGFQDLYVGSWGDPGDGLDFRSSSGAPGNTDRLFLNQGDGTFRDITHSAFGEAANRRAATGIACADVDGDGWLDLYVGNLLDGDFRVFDNPSHPGHYNLLYRNNRNLTFTDVSEEAGVRGPQILMREPDGQRVLFEEPESGERFEGYDPSGKDRLGNRMGEPTGQTHAVMFFDFDDDRDPDLWVANDGDRLHLFRNDSTPGQIRFTPVARALGIDKVGAWMGFALGDYDGDVDLDLFITNIGFHPLLAPVKTTPRGSCSYHMRFEWGTCAHFLLRNDGVREVPGVGRVGDFKDVAPSTTVSPSPWMPPLSLDPSNILPDYTVPTGLAAYDFGFGTTFFDFDNDGDPDLYWLGSTVGRGGGPGGAIFPGAGRMLRNDGRGAFEDITVRARLLDIVGADYAGLEGEPIPLDPAEAERRRIHPKFHENGKGLAHGDLNGDGWLDLIATNSSGAVFLGDDPPEAGAKRRTRSLPGPVFVWMNGGGRHHWITLRLRGRTAIDGAGSNADGIGARVYLTAGGRTQVQEVYAGSSYLSMDSVELEFGLGDATAVEQIRVLWPSGREQTLKNLEADRAVLVTEPAATHAPKE